MMRTTMTRSLQVSLETVCVCWLVMIGYGRVIDLCFFNEAVRAHCVCVCVFRHTGAEDLEEGLSGCEAE